MPPTRPRSPSLQSVTSAGTEQSSSGERARRIWEQQQQDDQDSMRRRLPALLAFLFELLLKPIFVAGEPFDVYMRKVAMLTQSAMCLASPGIAIWMAVGASTDEHGWNSKRIGMIVVCLHVSVQHIVFNYMYLRRTKTCPTWLVEFALFGAEGALLTMTLALQPIDSRSLALCSLLVAALMSSRLLPLHALLHGGIYMLHHFRSLYTSAIPQLVFEWDSDEYYLSEKIMYSFVLTFPAMMAVVGLYVIVSGYIKRNKEAQVANVMTITVADQLQRYDTAAVGATIEEHTGQMSEKLLEAFAAIRENLDSYRPHIPRYLIDAAIERAEDAEQRRLIKVVDDDGTTTDGFLAQEMSEGSLTSEAGASIRRVKSVPSGDMSPLNGSLSLSARPPVHQTSGFTGNITSMYLRLIDFERPLSQFFSMTELNRAVEELNVLAATTSASVHHVEEGVMAITWNATKRTANHEIRACTFAAKALALLQEHESFRGTAAAAILSCKATAHFAGTSQMHFVLSHEDMRRHRYLLEVATRHKTVVCTPSVVRNADIQFAFGAFALDCKGKMMYELAQSRDTGSEDEWMYALHSQQRQENDPYCRLTTAAAKLLLSHDEACKLPGVSAIADDLDSTPAQLLQSLPDEVRSRSTVQELQQKLSS